MGTACAVGAEAVDHRLRHGAVAYVAAEHAVFLLDQRRARGEALEAQCAADRQKLAESDAALQQLNERILQYTVELQKKEGDANVIRERIAFLRRQRESDAAAASEGRARLAAIAKELSAAQKAAKSNDAKAADSRREIASLEGEVAELSQKAAEYEELSDRTQRSVIDSIQDLSEIRRNIGTLSARKEAVEERIREVAAAAEEAKRDLAAAQKALSDCEDWQAELDEYVSREGQARAEGERGLEQLTQA